MWFFFYSTKVMLFNLNRLKVVYLTAYFYKSTWKQLTSQDHTSLTALPQATRWAVLPTDFIDYAVISSST